MHIYDDACRTTLAAEKYASTSEPNAPVTVPAGISRLDMGILLPAWATVFVGMLWIYAIRPFVAQIAGDLGTTVPVVGQVMTGAYQPTPPLPGTSSKR